jgi:hypothetical protein
MKVFVTLDLGADGLGHLSPHTKMQRHTISYIRVLLILVLLGAIQCQAVDYQTFLSFENNGCSVHVDEVISTDSSSSSTEFTLTVPRSNKLQQVNNLQVQSLTSSVTIQSVRSTSTQINVQMKSIVPSVRYSVRMVYDIESISYYLGNLFIWSYMVGDSDSSSLTLKVIGDGIDNSITIPSYDEYNPPYYVWTNFIGLERYYIAFTKESLCNTTIPYDRTRKAALGVTIIVLGLWAIGCCCISCCCCFMCTRLSAKPVYYNNNNNKVIERNEYIFNHNNAKELVESPPPPKPVQQIQQQFVPPPQPPQPIVKPSKFYTMECTSDRY